MTMELKASERILESSERILKASERILEASEKMSDSFKGLAQAILKGVYQPDVVSRNSAVAQAQEAVQSDNTMPIPKDKNKAIMLDVLLDPILASTYLCIEDGNVNYEWLLYHIKLEEAKRKKELQ
ncbi:hypothetical protein K3495_g10358 [Podosphaera aphanis]|nr:hypothetical protein K3495_g10358 [Podosphaera aphanis]